MSPARKRRRWFWVAVVLVLAGGGYALARRKGGGEKAVDPSLVVKVKRGDLQISVIDTGKVQPREKVEVKSKVAGQVERVFVDEGAHVHKGEKLLRLDPTDFRRDVARTEADLRRAEAEVAQAKNALEFARLTLERKQRGLEARGVAQADVDLAQSEVKSKTVAVQTAEVVVTGARVALGAAEDRLRYTEILAPMDGTVIQRGIEAGEVVTPGVQATFEGKALLTVADLSVLIVRAELNQIDVAKVRLGQKVTLTLDALPGQEYGATVTKIAPASTTPKGKDVDVFPVEATLDKVDNAIKPGMTADVKIHIETKHGVLVLPIEAVIKEAGKHYVTKIAAGLTDGKPQTDKIEVKVGARNDRELELAAGASEGEAVMIKPPSAAENEVKM
jgi:HlyD family secretion protein/macrolide-specific efflux system membrane fusion protein